MATIREVSALAGVSIATVSRFLNKNGYVNKDTEQRIIYAIKELDYKPNAVARGLAGKGMATIGLILPDITNPFFPELARAVEDVSQQSGYTVFLCNSDDRSFKEKAYIELLKKRNIDGIIFVSNSLEKDEIDKLVVSGIPLVVLDRAPHGVSCSVVRSNNYEGARTAIDHLLSVGCKKIGHIYGPLETSTAKERLHGYEDALRDLPWYSPSLMAPGNFQVEDGAKAMEMLLNRHPDMDGVFAGNDLMAVGALKVLHRRGLKVPDDIALCGFDGIKMTELTLPEITTVVQPIYQMGKKAAEILFQKIQDDSDDCSVHELSVHLSVRQSSKKGIIDH